MGRNFILSVIFLMLFGGAGFALPDWINFYDFYGTPSSGLLAPSAAATDISSVNQPHGALQFFKGVILPNGNISYFYKIPSSGSLDLTVTSIEPSDASPVFMPMPEGGFGPSTASFQSRKPRGGPVRFHPFSVRIV